jgi:hypothetical protein
MKAIKITNKKTGEISEGTAVFISPIVKLSRQTLVTKLEKGDFETDDFLIENVKSEVNISIEVTRNVKDKSQNVNPTPEILTQNVKSGQNVKIQLNISDDLSDLQESDGNVKPVEREKIIIPSGNCVIKGCGRKIYHTKEYKGQIYFVCFKKCQDINPKPEPIPPDPAKLAYLQNYIKQNTPQGKIKPGSKIETP